MLDVLVAQAENLTEIKDALAEVKDSVTAGSDATGLDSVILGEQFYFFTVVLMWLIHAGFMSYETGVARKKNCLLYTSPSPRDS